MTDRFARHGPVRVAAGGYHLAHADRTPFFFLADTAWNGALLASEADWAEYLADRAAKGFTAIQFIITAPWTAALTDADGHVAFDPRGEPVEAFFKRMDSRVDAINAAGLLAVPVLAWAANFGASVKLNPGATLSAPELARRLAYVIRRYKTRHLMWILAGDGKYGGFRSWKWKSVGRQLFGAVPSTTRAPVALHPMGKTWPYASFRDEGWLDVYGYQTSHADDDQTLRWMHEGPASQDWRHHRKPIINLEPCYEGIRNWGSAGPITRPITNAEVRRAMYASLLNTPIAGVAYGAHGVWSWESEPREPLNHPGSGVAQPWRQAMALPGSSDVARIATLFSSINWPRLRPSPALLATQPGKADAERFVSASATEAGDLALLYLPMGGSIELAEDRIRGTRAQWFDPRTGDRRDADIGPTGGCSAPDSEDWLLMLTKP